MARFITSITSVTNSLRRRPRDERGQMLLFAALLLPVLLGMTAMAVDLGGYASERRDLQNAADSIALAAAQELPDDGAAATVANNWAATNGIDPATMSVTVTLTGADNPNPSVRVVIDRTHEFHFARVLGIDSANVGAAATAIKTSPGGGANLVPWAVLESAKQSVDPGDPLVLKYDANNVANGNFGAIRIDGNGGSVYENTIEGGSDFTVCAKGVVGCADTSPVCVDYICQSQTGNMVGSTRTGVNWRMANTDAHCDDFKDVFVDIGDEYQVVNECNPWIDGGYQNERLIMVPIISSLCNGSCSYEIVEFGLFWLEGYGGGKCSGSACEVVGRFINAEMTVNALTGNYDPDSSVHYVRLSE